MCFSATASFTASAVLIPLGAYTMVRAQQRTPQLQLLSAFPVLFGVQQFAEGMVWQSVPAQGSVQGGVAAFVFLLFAYFVWPFVTPLAAYLAEPAGRRRRLLMWFTLAGALFGLLLYVPLFFHPDWLVVRLERASILYDTTLILEQWMPRTVIRLAYATLVVVPLLLSGNRYIRLFGLIIMVSVLFSAVVYKYAFVSVWCFFAAVLSAYIVYVIHRSSQQVA